MRESIELYLPSADVVPTWGIDYEVWPLHRTDGLSIRPEFDDSRDLPTRTITARCPTELASRELAVDDAVDDVVHLRIAANSDTDADRSVDVYYPHGSRSITVDTSSVNPSTSAQGEWYVVVQPLFGEPRIALSHLETIGEAVVVDRVPAGPVLIHVVRTTVVDVGPAAGTLVAPIGFAELWTDVVGQWYVASTNLVEGAETVTPAVLIGDGSRWQRLGLLIRQAYDVARPNTLASLANMNEPKAVSVPCGTNSSFRLIGSGTATLTIGGVSWHATATTGSTLAPACPAGSDHVDAILTGSSGRRTSSFVALVGGVP